MKRFCGSLVIVLVVVGFLAACAPPAAPASTPTAAAKPPTAAATPTPAAVAAPTTAPPKATAVPPTPTPKPATLKIGSTQSASDTGIYIAIDKGYFKEQGITMELVNFRSVGELVPPVATGQVDIVSMPLSSALVAAADRGVELKIVADKAQGRPKWDSAWIVLRKDLADSGQVKTPADLKGMKVAVPSLGSIGEQTVEIMLQQVGLKLTDIELVVLPHAEQVTALGNKAVAAGYTVDPYIARGVQEGFVVKWIPNSQLFGGRIQTNVVVFGPAMLKDQDLARRWMTAYLKGGRDYVNAFGSRGAARDEAVSIAIKYSTVTDPKLYDLMEVSYSDPNGELDRKSLDAQFKWWVEKGVYTGKKTFNDLVDLSYAEYAAQKLGRQQ